MGILQIVFSLLRVSLAKTPFALFHKHLRRLATLLPVPQFAALRLRTSENCMDCALDTDSN